MSGSDHDTPPDDRGWIDLGTRMSNCEGTIDPGTEDLLRKGGRFCGYAAWDFYAMVWFEADQFHAYCMQSGAHTATISAASLEDLMRICSDRLGYR